jgi:uncharacterized protein YndB with AHSA1/START domain
VEGVVEGQKVERRVELQAGAAAVWRALTRNAELSVWFGAQVELEPRSGGRAVFLWPDGRRRDARVEVFDPERQLLLRWFPFERQEDGATESKAPGYIRFVLEPHDEETVLTVTEALFGEPPGATMKSAAHESNRLVS